MAEAPKDTFDTPTIHDRDAWITLRGILDSGYARVREFNKGSEEDRQFAEREIAKAKALFEALQDAAFPQEDADDE